MGSRRRARQVLRSVSLTGKACGRVPFELKRDPDAARANKIIFVSMHSQAGGCYKVIYLKVIFDSNAAAAKLLGNTSEVFILKEVFSVFSRVSRRLKKEACDMSTGQGRCWLDV